MALSTLNSPLPALEDLITLTPRPPQPITPKTPTKKKLGPRLSCHIRRDILLLRDLNDNDDEIEYTYERIATILSRRHGRKLLYAEYEGSSQLGLMLSKMYPVAAGLSPMLWSQVWKRGIVGS
jgi:hypothetical protein